MKDYKYSFPNNIVLDSCAFDPDMPGEKECSNKLLMWQDEMVISIYLPHSVLEEMNHPNTPPEVKKKANELVYTYKMPLTPQQQEILRRVEEIIVGRGTLDNHQDDALHLFLGQDGRYFVTTDKKILRKKYKIKELFSGMDICKPSEMVEVIQKHKEAEERIRKWRKERGME